MTTATLDRPDRKTKATPRFVEAVRRDANQRELLIIAQQDGLTECVILLQDWVETGKRVRQWQKEREANNANRTH